MSNSQAVWDHIANTADPIAGTGSLWQYGRVNAVNAVCFPAPTNLRVGTVTPGSMQLLWNDNTPAEGFFQLATRISGTTLWQTRFTTLPANTTSYTQPGLTDGVSYDHELRACDQAGCSDWSNMVTANAGFEGLSVSLLGAGKVTSSPPGIACGSGSTACSYLYPPGTVVSLSALGVGNVGKFILWVFDHWEGACTGFSCTLTMNAAHSTRAVFVRDTP